MPGSHSSSFSTVEAAPRNTTSLLLLAMECHGSKHVQGPQGRGKQIVNQNLLGQDKWKEGMKQKVSVGTVQPCLLYDCITMSSSCWWLYLFELFCTNFFPTCIVSSTSQLHVLPAQVCKMNVDTDTQWAYWEGELPRTLDKIGLLGELSQDMMRSRRLGVNRKIKGLILCTVHILYIYNIY